MPSMKPFILNQLLLLNEFHKTASINQHLVWPWVLFACIRWRGSIYQGLPDAVRVSVPPALHELPVSWLSASSLTIKISLACSLSELTVHTTCCFTPRSKGYISSFLLELSLKHWCCEPPPTLILQFQLTFHAQQHRWCLFQETLLHLLLSFLLCSHGFVTTPSHCIFKYFSFIIKGTQAYSTKFGGGQKEQVCLLESPTCNGRNLEDA